jgi:hypothetical protein
MSSKTKTGDRAEREVLRSQKHQEPPAPKPKTTATVTLKSGEKRTVEIEATNDKEWNDLTALAEGGGDLSLDQKDITHRTIAAIVALRIAHEDEWKPYCVRRGMKWPKEVKSPFRPAALWVLNQAKAKTGENHSSKASMIAGCIDDIWEYEMAGIDGDTNEPIDALPPDNIAAWLDTHGGYTTIYARRRGRNKEPADKREARYRRFLNLPPLEQRDIPDWLDGFAGDVVIAAHIDPATGKIDYRSVWQPEGSAFWRSKLDQFIAARPDYGKAVEPVRMPRAEPMFDLDDGEAKAELSAQRRNEDAVQPPATAAIDAEKAADEPCTVVEAVEQIKARVKPGEPSPVPVVKRTTDEILAAIDAMGDTPQAKKKAAQRARAEAKVKANNAALKAEMFPDAKTSTESSAPPPQAQNVATADFTRWAETVEGDAAAMDQPQSLCPECGKRYGMLRHWATCSLSDPDDPFGIKAAA